MWRGVAAAIAVAAGLNGGAADAHPHMWFDATAELLLRDDGVLEGVRVVYVVDEFNSAETLRVLGLDADGDGALTAEEEQIAAEAMTNGLSAYDYFVDLRIAKERVLLDRPFETFILYSQGQLAARFEFAAPGAPDLSGASASLALYDPTYFTEVRMVRDVAALGSPACSIEMKRFKSSAQLAAYQTLLSQLARDEATSLENVGALFADRANLSCAGG